MPFIEGTGYNENKKGNIYETIVLGCDICHKREIFRNKSIYTMAPKWYIEYKINKWIFICETCKNSK